MAPRRKKVNYKKRPRWDDISTNRAFNRERLPRIIANREAKGKREDNPRKNGRYGRDPKKLKKATVTKASLLAQIAFHVRKALTESNYEVAEHHMNEARKAMARAEAHGWSNEAMRVASQAVKKAARK